MKSIFIFLLFSLSICSTSAQVNQLQIQIQEILDSLYAEHPKSVGLMVHVEAPNYKISNSFAVGYTDTVHQIQIQKDQPVGIASNTKTYTSAAILRLIEEGKMELYQGIGELLSSKTKTELRKDGYDLNQIKVYHLLSHTSGIEDYIDDNYLKFAEENPKYRWTRDEQIARTVVVGNKLGDPGDVFSYADINFILLTEIIEQLTNTPFYDAMRELLKYDKLELNDTWFFTLEDRPKNTKESVVQYYSKYKVNSFDLDPSFDLFGAGGIWATTKDLARFNYALFDEQIIQDSDVFDLLYTPAKTKDKIDHQYFLGVQEYNLNGVKAYGHGGFWGTMVYFVPELDLCISICILEKDLRVLREEIGKEIITLFQKEND